MASPPSPTEDQNRAPHQTHTLIKPEDVSTPEFARSDDMALQHVRTRYRNMYDYKARYTERNNVHYEMYRGYQRPRTYPFSTTIRSNIHVPYAFATVEQIVPRIVQACLNDGHNFFNLRPREPSDAKNARQHKKLLLWQLGLMDFFIEFTMMIKTVSMFGYCAAKIDWLFKTGERRRLKMKDEFVQQEIDDAIREKYGHALYEEVLEENFIEYDNNRFSCLDWDEAYPDEAAKYTLHTGRDFLHQTKTTYRELFKRKKPDGTPVYKNLDRLEFKHSYSQEDSDQDRRLSTIGASKATWRQHSRMEMDKAAQEVVLWEYWTPDWVITVANQNTVIRRDPNPFWHQRLPFVDLNYSYVPNEMFGIGAIESFRDLQTALNVVTNMDLDNWAMMVNQMFVVHDKANIPQEQMVSRPWGVAYSRVPPREAVFPIPRQSIAGETSMKQQEMRANIQLASGLTDMHFLGTSMGSRVGRTATGMMMANEETNVRFQMIVAMTEFMALRPMLKMMTSNNHQFLRASKWVEIIGKSKEPEIIHPEDIWGEVDISFTGAQRVARQQLDQHNFVNFLRSIGNSPFLLNQLKPRKLVREALSRFITEDPEEYMVPGPDTMLTPEEENSLMKWGQRVQPSVDEDLMAHLQSHLMEQNHETYQTWKMEAQQEMELHIQETTRLIGLMEGGKLGADQAQPMDQAGLAQQQGSLTREAMGVTPNEPGGRNEYETGQV